MWETKRGRKAGARRSVARSSFRARYAGLHARDNSAGERICLTNAATRRTMGADAVVGHDALRYTWALRRGPCPLARCLPQCLDFSLCYRLQLVLRPRFTVLSTARPGELRDVFTIDAARLRFALGRGGLAAKVHDILARHGVTGPPPHPSPEPPHTCAQGDVNTVATGKCLPTAREVNGDEAGTVEQVRYPQPTV